MTIKAREVRERLKKVNVHPQVKLINEALAEEVYQHHLTLQEVATTLDQYATVLNALSNAVGIAIQNFEAAGKRVKDLDLEGVEHVTK